MHHALKNSPDDALQTPSSEWDGAIILDGATLGTILSCKGFAPSVIQQIFYPQSYEPW